MNKAADPFTQLKASLKEKRADTLIKAARIAMWFLPSERRALIDPTHETDVKENLKRLGQQSSIYSLVHDELGLKVTGVDERAMNGHEAGRILGAPLRLFSRLTSRVSMPMAGTADGLDLIVQYANLVKRGRGAPHIPNDIQTACEEINISELREIARQVRKCCDLGKARIQGRGRA